MVTTAAVSEILLNLDRDWVLILHFYNDRLYVALLKMDPMGPDLILASLGMNFYPENYSTLLEVLHKQAVAEAHATPHRKRRVEVSRYTFTKNCYETGVAASGQHSPIRCVAE